MVVNIPKMPSYINGLVPEEIVDLNTTAIALHNTLGRVRLLRSVGGAGGKECRNPPMCSGPESWL